MPRRRWRSVGRAIFVAAFVGGVCLLVFGRPLLAWAGAHRKMAPKHVRPAPVPGDSLVLNLDVDPRTKAKYVPNIKRDAAVMREALRRVGFAETAGTWNRGPEVDAYLRSCRTKLGSPWCAAFVAHTIHTAYPKSKWLPSSSCQELFDWASRNGLVVDKPAPATVVLYPGESGGYHHIGFVVAFDKSKGVITTVEGNSNEDGAPEGREVVKIDRYVSPGAVYVRII